jgi:uncharacterized protein (DUF2336 family)
MGESLTEGALSIATRAERLIALAKARTPADRERLLLSIVELCETAELAGELCSDAVQALLNDIFMCLVIEAEHDIRARLAEALAEARWAPRALINVLALDDIEIARPVIASSPVLQDRDLIRLLVEATIEHQIEVARRPSLGPLVVDAILTYEEPAVLTALACNDTADIPAAGMTRMVEASRRIASLRSPLTRHPKLTPELGERLYLWVGQALRTVIVTRFTLDTEALDQAIADSVAAAQDEPFPDASAPLVVERSGEREEMERRLIAKLHDAGQLRAGYLLRALREDKLSLFEAALAKLGGFTSEQVRLAVDGDKPELLALACYSVGLDRGVFPTVLDLVRTLNGGRPSGDTDSAQQALNAFGGHPGSAAATAFRHAASAV